MRVSELVALRSNQIRLDDSRISIERLKGSDDSVQPLSGAELRALRRIKREQPAGTRYVFVSERGAPFSLFVRISGMHSREGIFGAYG